MKLSWRNPFFILGLVVLWRVALLVFTAQPVPGNDAFFFDGPVSNWILHGHYYNSSLAEAFPISGRQVFSAYPPLYEAVLTPWMLIFGVSVVSAMAFHLTLIILSGFIAVAIVKKFFPTSTLYSFVPLLLLAVTFTDRPEDLAHVFGLISLWLLARKISGQDGWGTTLALTLTLWLTLYTSTVVGAFYFGAGFLTGAVAWLKQRKFCLFIPFFTAALLFVAVTFTIAKTEPLLWHGFLENARQTPMLVNGFHAPSPAEILKLIRSAPVFLLALFVLPWAWSRREQFLLTENGWWFLTVGIFLMGWLLLVLSMVLISPNYVYYVVNAQILLAAGLIACLEKVTAQAGSPSRNPFLIHRLFISTLTVCVLLVSIRAIGMTTWGAACAWKNGYWQMHEQLRAELKPFADTDAPVIVSSAFLYSAFEFDVRRAIHSDWYYDRASGPPGTTGYQVFLKLRPTKLVLTQFDYYRGFADLVRRLQQQPELVTVRMHDFAAVRPPDAIPSMSRVVQNISWAPIVVDLDWKN